MNHTHIQGGNVIRRDRSYSRERNKKDNNNDYRNIPIKLFLEEKYLNELIEFDLINKIKRKYNIGGIYIDKYLRIPNTDGRFLVIKEEGSIKYKVCSKIIKDYYKFLVNTYNGRSNKGICVLITIPEGVTSQFIGSKGRNINNLMNKCNVKIVVNPSVESMRDRTVTIDGHYRDVIYSIETVYERVNMLCQDNSNKSNRLDGNLVKSDSSIMAKLVFDGNIVDNIDSIFKSNGKGYNVNVNIESNMDNYDLKGIDNNKDKVLILDGLLKDVKLYINDLLLSINEYYLLRNEAFENVRVIIENSFVTKLIGSKGSMVRDIAAKSSGAQIKILSDKESEKNFRDCIVSIAGSLSNKKEATVIILEQIEIFKTGAPVLINSKILGININNTLKGDRNSNNNIKDKDKEYYNYNNNNNFKYKYDNNNKRRRNEESDEDTEFRFKTKEEVLHINNSNNNDDDNDVKVEYSNRDNTKNISYMRNGELEVNSLIVIPDYIIKHIEKNKLEVFNDIEDRYNCRINIKRDNNNNNIQTNEGIKGRLLGIYGNINNVTNSYKEILSKVIEIETSINGERVINSQ